MDEQTNSSTASTRIDMLRGADVAYWCHLFGVEAADLRRAVQQVGPRVQAVHQYLSEHPPKPH
ncbi:MAG: DUF3606 domain-containing protein [Burkholderiales bacterium]|nr:DUF3606 domain-containing protein [Burkholderiales bacterium]MDE2397730.1 DUF3606 domain-containing protein [Burkholderiales bacterium]MDE2452201.1 DUF3606 domain-containing protein [Burkholderiales bacterium]